MIKSTSTEMEHKYCTKKEFPDKNEITVKFSTISLHQCGETPDDHKNEGGFRKAYVAPNKAWDTLERSLKIKHNNAFISKVRYRDGDFDVINILTSQELEDAIFKEGISRFELLYYDTTQFYGIAPSSPPPCTPHVCSPHCNSSRY